MYVVLVHIHIKPENAEEFLQATLENARNSIQEPGIGRFDVLQQQDDPTRFVLVEAYHSPDDQLKHRETRHYQIWKDKVAEMMAEPRTGVKHQSIFPDDTGWK